MLNRRVDGGDGGRIVLVAIRGRTAVQKKREECGDEINLTGCDSE